MTKNYLKIPLKSSKHDAENSPASSSSGSSSGLLAPIEAAREQNPFDTFVILGGRKYLNDDNLKYFMPSDDIEKDRLHICHYLKRYIWQSNFCSPVEDILTFGNAKVLDIGCGAGSWILECAKEYPLSTFVGLDIAPLFPTETPPNAGFIQCNVVDHCLPFPDDTFDFTIQQSLCQGVSFNDYIQKTFPEMIRVTKSNGYIELMEVDMVYCNPGPTAKLFENAFKEHVGPLGVVSHPVRLLQEEIKKCKKLYNFHKEERDYPLGSWAGRFGEMGLQNFIQCLSSVKAILAPAMGLSESEYDKKLTNLVTETDQFNTFVKLHRFYARKV